MYQPSYYQKRVKPHHFKLTQLSPLTVNFVKVGSQYISDRLILKLPKIFFLCTYIDQIIIQLCYIIVCSNFIFTIFSPMFLPFFSKVFTNILKIYKLPKVHNKLPKYCLKTFLNNNHLPGQFYRT